MLIGNGGEWNAAADWSEEDQDIDADCFRDGVGGLFLNGLLSSGEEVPDGAAGDIRQRREFPDGDGGTGSGAQHQRPKQIGADEFVQGGVSSHIHLVQ